jgi:hypothetical protein
MADPTLCKSKPDDLLHGYPSTLMQLTAHAPMIHPQPETLPCGLVYSALCKYIVPRFDNDEYVVTNTGASLCALKENKSELSWPSSFNISVIPDWQGSASTCP